jgi:hypothetical protein
MSAKHTPGPWAIDGCASLGNLDVIYGSGRITMMDCENDEVDDDALLANARLITAAPEMLVALDRAEAFISGFEDDDTQEGVTEMLAAIRVALAKAKGEA